MRQIQQVCRALGMVLLAAAAFGAEPENRLTAEEKAAGWKLLFDGKSMAGWEDPAKKSPPGDAWTIDQGWLKAARRPRITEDLFTKETFRDFELAFDWKISPGGNSGVKYRIQDHIFVDTSDPTVKKFEDQVERSYRNRSRGRQDHGQDYVVGFEYQVIDNRKNADALRGGALHQTGALYDMAAPSSDAARPVGEVNHSRLVVRGSHVEHWLNGVKVVDADLAAPAIAGSVAKRWGRQSPVYELLAGQPKKDCPISLQNHGDEAWFRNIKLRPLR